MGGDRHHVRHADPGRACHGSWAMDKAKHLFGDFTRMDVVLYIVVACASPFTRLFMGGMDDLTLVAMGAAVNMGTVTVILLVLRGPRRRLRIRRDARKRCKYLLDRIWELLDMIPRRTEAETLAVIHEIRICYAEIVELVDKMGEGGTPFAIKLRMGLDDIRRQYDIQAGSLRCTKANAADFHAAMRGLGRDADGTLR